jgi:hypothetical protein
MKFVLVVLSFLFVACNGNGIATTQTHQNTNQSFILNNVNIVDVENKTIHLAKSLVIENGKISSIHDEALQITSSDITMIDGNGGYITPGLIDMHVHFYEKAAYIFTLSHGVTHVRIMNGVPKQLEWRDNIEKGLQIGSTSTVSSPIVSGYKDANLHHGVETALEAQSAVREYKRQGYDLIKAYGNLNENALSAIIKEGIKLDIPIAKHGPHASGNMSIDQLTGFQSFEHVEDIFQGPLNHQFSREHLPKILQDIKATNVPVTPTLNIYYQLTKLSQEKHAYLATTSKEYTSDIIALEATYNQVERWLSASNSMADYNQKTLTFLKYITKRLHENEVPLLVGSDSGVLLSPHGIATHNEMRLLQESGIGAYNVLAAATINPAKALNLQNKMGMIAENYNADFIYSSLNPIVDLSVLQEPDAVIKNGRWYSKDTLKTMRDKAIEDRSFWEEFSVLLEGL